MMDRVSRITSRDIDRLAARLRRSPAAEAAQSWPFLWGVCSVGVFYVLGDAAFDRQSDAMYVSLNGVGAGLVLGAMLALCVSLGLYICGTRAVRNARETLDEILRAITVNEERAE